MGSLLVMWGKSHVVMKWENNNNKRNAKLFALSQALRTLCKLKSYFHVSFSLNQSEFFIFSQAVFFLSEVMILVGIVQSSQVSFPNWLSYRALT